MINQVEWYLGQLRYMNGLQIDANNRNAELLQQVSRLKAENQRLRAHINQREALQNASSATHQAWA